jgi:hypothetical protein
VRGLVLALLAACAAWGCAKDVVYDYGEGPVNAEGKSVAPPAEPSRGELEYETESNAEVNEDEAIYDDVGDAER